MGRMNLFFAVVFLASPAVACPTAEDLRSGIVIERDVRNMQGKFHRMVDYLREMPDGQIATTFRPQLTDDLWQTWTIAGLFKTHAQRTSGALRAEGQFGPELTQLLPISANQTAQINGTWERDGRVWQSVYTLETGAPETVSLAGCSYHGFMLVLEDTRTRPDGNVGSSTLRGHYIPDLRYVLGPDSEREKTVGLRRPGLLERLHWPFSAP